MRPWKIIVSGVAAALVVSVALLRPGLSTVPPDGLAPLLLSRLPALVLLLIAIYALVAILFSSGGLIAAAFELRRELARTDALREATAALDWIAAFDTTALRGLVPRLVGALPKSSTRGATILVGNRFERRAARAEVAHLYYIWLARSHCLAALVALAAIAALGFAQSQGGASFLAVKIPTAAAVLILCGSLFLILLARFAIDVTVDPVIEAMSRLPWEPIDAGRLHRAVDLLEAARGDAAIGARAAPMPSELPERLAVALEDGNRGLSAASERLSAAAEAMGVLAQSTIEALAVTFRGGAPAAPDDRGEARSAALQAAVEALTAELRESAAAERLPDVLDRDRRALADAVERLSTAAEAIGTMTRLATDTFEAARREAAADSPRTATQPDAAAEGAVLRTAVEALTAELRNFTALLGAEGEPSALGIADRAAAASDLGRELRRLLQGIGPETH